MKKTIIAVIAGVFLVSVNVFAKDKKPVEISSDVPVYEYVPEVIIEGKWGSGPGEFGTAQKFPLGYHEPYRPSSLAVDSKGNIYILDIANNRIQKFNSKGKHINDIPVESLKGEIKGYCYTEEGDKIQTCTDLTLPKKGTKYNSLVMGQLDIQGINIVIDSKDNLYYYLKRQSNRYTEKIKKLQEKAKTDWRAEQILNEKINENWIGEVWQFKDDKLVRKWEVPYFKGYLLDIRDDNLWITEYPFKYVRTDIGGDYDVIEGKQYPRKILEAELKRKKGEAGHLAKISGRKIKLKGSKYRKSVEIEVPNKIIGKPWITDNLKIAVLTKKKRRRIIRHYNWRGELLDMIYVDNKPRNGIRDKKGNVWRIKSSTGYLQIIKYMKTRKREEGE